MEEFGHFINETLLRNTIIHCRNTKRTNWNNIATLRAKVTGNNVATLILKPDSIKLLSRIQKLLQIF